MGKWKVSVEDGSVCIGSAAKKWAISKRIMEKYNTSFKQIFALTEADDITKLQEVAPIDEATLTMIIEHLPTPRTAQAYRIPHLWHGDLESLEGKAMMTVDAKAPACIVIFGIQYDPHGGEVAVGRVFSGTIRKGTDSLHLGQGGHAEDTARSGSTWPPRGSSSTRSPRATSLR